MTNGALEYYEMIAEDYDEETKSPVMLAEDIVLFDFLKNEGLLRGRVLDAGCGTGLFLDQCYWPKWDIEHYIGYDLSKSMLNKFGKKWPSFRQFIHQMSFLDDHDKFGDAFTSVVSLYAGLNCLTRSEMKLAFENLWGCVKKGGTLCLMTYGSLTPEERDTSLHSILSDKKGYHYSMVEDFVLYEWLRSLPQSSNHRILPFSQPLPPDVSEPTTGSDNMGSILYHKDRIEEDLEEVCLEIEGMHYSKKGGTSRKECSFYLCLADKF